MINKKIIICCTVKNEAKNLKRFFSVLENFIFNFDDYFIVFVESDSSDNSLELINNFLMNKKGVVLKESINKNYNRIKNLEICRNRYLDYVKKNSSISNFDYLIVMDVDGVNNRINFKNIKNSINSLKDWTAIFPNQTFFYYDIFALRINNFIEKNYIENIKNDYLNNKFRSLKKNINFNLQKYFFLNKKFKNRFIEVRSAFGGMGIYKLDKIKEFKYESLDGMQCEHVILNESLSKKYGNLYIDRKLYNSTGINIHTINGLLCSNLNFFAKRFYSKIT